jgi:hypothetical protein
VVAVARISLGSKRVVVPIYVLSGVLMIADHVALDESVGRLGVLSFLVGAHFQIMAKADRNRACMLAELEQIKVCLLKKIDQSVGKVWDAGGRAERRRAEVESESRPLAAVRDLEPRR